MFYNECFAPELYFRLHAFQSQIIGDDGRPAFDNPQTLKAYISFRRTIHLLQSRITYRRRTCRSSMTSCAEIQPC